MAAAPDPIEASAGDLGADASPTLLGGDAVDVAEAVAAVLRGRTGGPAALATVIGRSGSAPQIVGAKLLCHHDGRVVGTVGGGAIEARVLDACARALRSGRPQRVEHNLVRDLAMCCGGSMEVFVEYLQPLARLIIVGGGHVSRAIAPVAKLAGFRVHVLDDREELLQDEAFAEMQTSAHDVDELDAALPDLGAEDFVLIVTRDHDRDERALQHLVRRPHRYVGMIGSRRKVHRVVKRIVAKEEAAGRGKPDLSRVRAPIGLALGGRTPGEIAVSVVAELIAVRHGGGGATMSVVADLVE